MGKLPRLLKWRCASLILVWWREGGKGRGRGGRENKRKREGEGGRERDHMLHAQELE